MGTYRPATADDISSMQAIGAAAGRRYAEIEDRRIAACADDDPPDGDALLAWVDAARSWVASEPDAPSSIVGFLVVDVVDGNAHVEEVAVHPDHEGRGHASCLLDTVTQWARDHDMPVVTLTTFSDVPWNRPYYERRGFRVLSGGDIGPGLRARVVAESAHGLPADLRVCMGRTV